MELRQQSPFPIVRKYQRHSDDCSGHDWAVVEQVVTAGTIDILPPDAHVCDCDRAAIIHRLNDMQAARLILKVNNNTLKRLNELGQRLWAQK